MKIEHCLRCDGYWCFRGTGRALRCGVCGSPYWDQERKKGAEKIAGAGIDANSKIGEVPSVETERNGVKSPAEAKEPRPAPKPDMASLRAICAVDVTRPATEFGGYAAAIDEHLAEDSSGPACANPDCGAPMRESKGKWACVDEACGMCGVEQKLKRQK